MSVFVDTSALYAAFDRDDEFHSAARDAWGRLLADEPILMTTSYVLVESFALVQNRLGIPAVRTLHDDVVSVLEVQWVTPEDHRGGVEAMIAADRRGLGLVDCTSLGVMQRLGVRTAFAFDRHFAERGFTLLPS